MIVVMEGPSAAGKTTWCRTYCPGNVVEAAPESLAAPDLYGDPVEVANFWIDFHKKQWLAALQIEKEKGVAICDGDPLHLYFSWSLWKGGALPNDLFEAELPLYRRAVEEGSVGFADVVLWLEAPVEELRRRAKSDSTRRRRRHELYLSLIPWMKKWFLTREQMLPETVRETPNQFAVEDFRNFPASPRRNDAARFDRMIDILNKP
jgi:hypothetical protein